MLNSRDVNFIKEMNTKFLKLKLVSVFWTSAIITKARIPRIPKKLGHIGVGWCCALKKYKTDEADQVGSSRCLI